MSEQIGYNPEENTQGLAKEFDYSVLGIGNFAELRETPGGRKILLDRVREGFATYARTVFDQPQLTQSPEFQIQDHDLNAKIY